MKDVKVLIPYIATAMITGLIMWFIMRGNDDKTVEGPNYKKEYNQSQQRVDQLMKDSVSMRELMAEQDAEWSKKYLDKQLELRRLAKDYEKINFNNHTAVELDSIRKRILSELE